MKLKEINSSFSEIKENDFDILVVNSDQTWLFGGNDYLDIGFLNFSRGWNKKKFIYGASFGINNWPFSKEIDINIKNILKNFTGVSVRENCAVDLVQQHLGIKPELVLDPTLLINKKHYLNLIRNYKGNFDINQNYLCFFLLIKNEQKLNFVKESIKFLNYKNYSINPEINDYVEDFLFSIKNSKAVITDSFHGTVFSIIFNKPFISFYNYDDGRLPSLGEILDVSERIFVINQTSYINKSLLTKPLNVNIPKFNLLKKNSLDYLKKNLFQKGIN